MGGVRAHLGRTSSYLGSRFYVTPKRTYYYRTPINSFGLWVVIEAKKVGFESFKNTWTISCYESLNYTKYFFRSRIYTTLRMMLRFWNNSLKIRIREKSNTKSAKSNCNLAIYFEKKNPSAIPLFDLPGLLIFHPSTFCVE